MYILRARLCTYVHAFLYAEPITYVCTYARTNIRFFMTHVCEDIHMRLIQKSMLVARHIELKKFQSCLLCTKSKHLMAPTQFVPSTVPQLVEDHVT
jgi:hypothetical protein